MRYTYQENFEMLMVRHEYLSKVDNVDPQWVKKFEPIVKKTASLMYNKLRSNFIKVGYELDDVVTITNCYMIGYMGLYSLERNEQSKEKIIKSYKKRLDREPTEYELERKEKINMISFLRQRLQHASVICARKARNITVGSDERANYALTKNSISASDELILEKGESLGYRKITKDEMKDIKLKARINHSKELLDKDGYRIVQIEILNEGITEYDYQGLFLSDKKDLFHNSPEEAYVLRERDADLSLIMEEFESLSSKEKKDTLKAFIDRYRGDKRYKKELTTARKMLKEM